MAVYTSKEQAKAALQAARGRLVAARKTKDKQAYDEAMKECQNIQYVLDRWF